ncbi:S8 family serine peptidase [Actinosynnema sp. NPDC047251]|uniref:Peptidase S8/S53, subtilisin kexin sedolisin n=1 Tax=Saccharothrix espanaensis (strain ATCC 51144 / DSM 44229 / JCM 9112 / NBRC 15066 / NRRL 15764) TaxID=1179773 RepID=K0JTK2_SACES|nr:S8 family serine peptidase [Saccharothrix espanaensis]CCH29261.1 Peptidase S8/S53, subtilisin kexin sedolisin [Saccharothrix espanaensis DSM 44229]
MPEESPTTTGRYLVLLEDNSVAAGVREMSRVAGITAASTTESVSPEELAASDGIIFQELGIAVVNAAPEQVTRLARAADEPGPIAVVEPERIVQALTAPAAAEETASTLVDESVYTWGLQAVGATLSSATGAGVRLAVLDTGFTVDHPDFAGRAVLTNSFIKGETVDDAHGHGTHCIGSAAGPRKPVTGGPGYGVAHEAEIYAGKVLSNAGFGDDGGILNGIAWAVANGCAVVSMSLGAAVRPGTPYSQIFEQAAQRALAKNTLIIAAAGNESRRPNAVAPVGHPANCPSIMSVGAIDDQRALAFFSCGTVDTVGQVDGVGPGVNVYSSWNGKTEATRHKRIQGTSMATPHVAGIAALLAQQYNARGWELWARLMQSGRRLGLPSTDVGAGLVQAP